MDLRQIFNSFINKMFVKINGHTCERMPDNKFKYKDFIGTREEVKAKINEAKIHLQNSINKSKKQPTP